MILILTLIYFICVTGVLTIMKVDYIFTPNKKEDLVTDLIVAYTPILNTLLIVGYLVCVIIDFVFESIFKLFRR